MDYNNFNEIKRLQAKQRELEKELEKNDDLRDKCLIITEIDRIDKEIRRISEDRIF